MYSINTTAQHQRRERIQSAINASLKTYTFHEFQNRQTELKQVRLEIGLPIYRMTNYRTVTAQLRHIKDHSCPDDFFSVGQENESAQQAQHEILTKFAKQGRDVSITPIMEELKTEEQRDPLIITIDGVVVNGNRRLAAMRELIDEQPTEYRRFSHVLCAVLPLEVTPEEIREIEVRLQMQPETKLPYGWIDEAKAIKDMLDTGRSKAHVVSLMKKKTKTIERTVQALHEVDIYLKEYVCEPDDYNRVESAEQFFKDLAKALEGKEGHDLEISRRIAWALISNVDDLNRRVYDYNFSFEKNNSDVVRQLSSRLGLDQVRTPDENGQSSGNGDGDLEIDIGVEDDQSDVLSQLIDRFDDTDQRDSTTSELINTCESVYEQRRIGAVGLRALSNIQVANKKLQEVDLSNADPATYGEINTQLLSVKERCESLYDSLESINNGSE